MSGRQPEVSVVVASRNRAQLLPGLLAALAGQSNVVACQLVVVDDASEDDTPAVLPGLAARYPSLAVHRLPQHAGPAVARNVGWRASTGDVIVFTDDDCLPDPGWLSGLMRAHAAGADVAQGRTVPEVERPADRGTFGHWVEVAEFTHRYETCNISYRRDVLERLHGFDESFGTTPGGPPYGEDTDLGWRAAKAGADCRFVADAIVRHRVSASSFPAAVGRRLRAGVVPYLIRKHPEYRAHLRYRYFLDEAHAIALVALAGWLACVAARRPAGVAVGVAASTPYVWFRLRVRRLPGRRRWWPVIVPAAWLLDVVETAVLARGSLRWRRLVL
jgi:GT2 family glycosyltransferase